MPAAEPVRRGGARRMPAQALRQPPGSDAVAPAAALPRTVATIAPAATNVERDGWLACLACGRFVAESRARIEVDGAHARSFINPAGVVFRIGCFAAAPGARAWGEPSDHFTWFAGFTWQLAACRGCGAHLGWAFAAAGASFVGLILARLVEHPPAPAAPPPS